jgi:hypothetical protein
MTMTVWFDDDADWPPNACEGDDCEGCDECDLRPDPDDLLEYPR